MQQLIDRPDRQLAASARALLPHALLAAANLDAAAHEAHAALEQGTGFPSTQPTALGALALVSMLRNEPTDALALADRGLEAGSCGIWPRDGSILRLVRAEALHAIGKINEAHAAIREARDRILRIAAPLDDAESRRCYMTQIGANARTLTLANEWLGEDTP